jgi:hypothetical protein
MTHETETTLWGRETWGALLQASLLKVTSKVNMVVVIKHNPWSAGKSEPLTPLKIDALRP